MCVHPYVCTRACVYTHKELYLISYVVVQSHRCDRLCNPWTAACQVSLSFIITWSLFKLVSIESVMPFNHLILCGPLVLLPSVLPSIRVFSSESAVCSRWLKNGASASVFPMNIQGWFPLGLNGLFSFHQRIDERSLICCPKDIPFSVCKYSIFHRLIILF